MMDPSKTVVAVGMSGGVDSSVAALRLKAAGYQVFGLFMKNWEEKDGDGVCQASKEYEDVVAVCDQIGIPHYSINFVKEYWDNVFSHFLDELKAGHTPNPDILCNREIKFKVLLEKAIALGADYLATGHYARIRFSNGKFQLLKGLDRSKDQSYFLYTLGEKTLNKVLFPIGDLLKIDLRMEAKVKNLATAEKKDSTGICFVGERNFKQFVSRYIPYQPGTFERLDGKVVGRHDGAAYYTIGQRKGMGIGGEGEAWFVVGKDISRNVVYVEQGANHPALFCDDLTASDLSWVNSAGPTALPYRCHAKVRYRQEDQECVIQEISGGKAIVTFDRPQRAVTPRQSIVFYDGDVCVGGGIIESAGETRYQKMNRGSL